MARRWYPSPLLQASAAIHAGALAGVALRPEAWPWALGALALDHGLLTAAGLWPRSRLLGPNWTRLPPAAASRGEVAVTIDDGPDPAVTPRVLQILARHEARASFFLIGARARRHPALVRDIVAAGHTVENHTEHHPHTFSLRGPAGLAREIVAAQATLGELAGRAPRFFRAPAGLRNPFLDPVLARLDLHLAAWTRRAYDTRTGDAATVLARLTRGLAGGDILLLHDGNAARSPGGEPVIVDALPRLLAALAEAGLRSVTLDSAIP